MPASGRLRRGVCAAFLLGPVLLFAQEAEEDAPQDPQAVLKELQEEKQKLIEEARKEREAARAAGAVDPKEFARMSKERAKLEKEAVKKAAADAAKEKERLWREFSVLGVETIVDTGDSAKRLDIVIVGDGWTDGKEIEEYRRTCKMMAAQMTDKLTPLHYYKSYVNFHRIDVVSKESGIVQGKPERTPFHTNINDINVMTSDRSQAFKYAGLARDVDHVIVVANTAKGRSTGGGSYITLVKTGIDATVNHEFGHSFGGLADEYEDKTIAQAWKVTVPKTEPGSVNLTIETNPLKVKWHYWNIPEQIFRGLAIAEKDFALDKRIGPVEGGGYLSKGIWRPAPACRMRGNSAENCPVCAEHMEKRFYRFVAPLDDSSPKSFHNALFLDEKIEFTVRSLQVEPPKSKRPEDLCSVELHWSIDGRRQKKEVKFSLTGSRLKPGRHTVACQLDFHTPRVRDDAGLLTGTQVWEVEVFPYPRPQFEIPGSQFKTKAGTALSIPVEYKAKFDEKQFQLKALGLPEGSAFEKGVFTWTPAAAQRGSYEVTFAFVRPSAQGDAQEPSLLAEALEEEVWTMRRMGHRWVADHYLRVDPRDILYEKKVRIDVVREAGDPNTSPRFVFQEIPAGAEGEELRFFLLAYDPDGDHLLFSAKGLPEGAELDPNTGEFYWIPTLTQGGTYGPIEVKVGDGTGTDKLGFSLRVADRSIGSRWGGGGGIDADKLFHGGADVYVGLHHENPGIRLASLAYLEGYPREARVREAARMLRDDSPEVRKEAMKQLSALFPATQQRTASRPGEYKDPEASAAEEPGDERPAGPVIDIGAVLQGLSLGEGMRTWQFVDAPEILEWLSAFTDHAAGVKGLGSVEKKLLKLLRRDLKAVAAYGARRGAGSPSR